MKTNKKQKYKVVGYDSFSHEEYPIGEFKTQGEAMEEARKHGGTMNLAYVYFKGEQLAKYGTY